MRPLLVLLPGFMASAGSYRQLGEHLSSSGIDVQVPQLYSRGLGALFGRASVSDEAILAADLVTELAMVHPRIWLGGHSRGGQAAWRASELLAKRSPGILSGLVLIDPVDGEGRRPNPSSTLVAPAMDVEPLVIGAGVAGPCAPEGVNHKAFAGACIRSGKAMTHLIVDQMGHADLLQGRARALGRRLCGGGPDPDAALELLVELLTSWIERGVIPVDCPGVRLQD